jgi:hypothetical protein
MDIGTAIVYSVGAVCITVLIIYLSIIYLATR